MYDHLKKHNGRIVYCGAGTSGRIGVQDGVELYPTLSLLNKTDFLLAGGNASLLQSIEKAKIIQIAEMIFERIYLKKILL